MNKKNIGTIRGLFLCIILMVFSVGTLIGCRGSRVDFTIALQDWGNGGIGGRKNLIVTCSNDWKELNFYSPIISKSLAEKLEELNQRYGEQFFINNAVVVFTFGFSTSGIRYNEIRLNRSGDELKLEVIVEVGFAETPSFGIVILEISNENISENTTLNAIIIREGLNVY
ncbi:MAG: hypothetical protein FWE36_01005 [Erysipelotrichales bacterium]|nr:hypothetical protein [Erysipelotrichales bacterium]